MPDGIESIEMRGESLRHSLIVSRTFAALHGRLDIERFEIACGNLKVIANGRVRVPDLLVFPNPGLLDLDAAPDPVLVVEVVSPSTRLVDNFDKNVDYAETQSIQHYVMLSEERRSAMVCSRTPAGWRSVEVEGSGPLSLPAVRAELQLDEIYRRISFESEMG